MGILIVITTIKIQEEEQQQCHKLQYVFKTCIFKYFHFQARMYKEIKNGKYKYSKYIFFKISMCII